ncbi:MAG: GntR family transcriptional regulator [Bacteroidales bacterium 45-6]|nr:MAG: GntR family transcriptional regulator [Bacteroidales bacterium 45-6]
MEFKENKPIYLQIIDFCFQKILKKDWMEEERIPSVRELAVSLEVNPNTVMRSFEYMQAEGVIYTKRGMGYFVEKNAFNIILKLQRKDFFEEVLPETFKAMDLLHVSIEEVVENYRERKI